MRQLVLELGRSSLVFWLAASAVGCNSSGKNNLAGADAVGGGAGEVGDGGSTGSGTKGGDGGSGGGGETSSGSGGRSSSSTGSGGNGAAGGSGGGASSTGGAGGGSGGSGGERQTTGLSCDSDLDCTPHGLLCDRVIYLCVECLVNEDCPGEADLCRTGRCEAHTPCENSLDCVDDAFVCDTGLGSCVECVTAADCPDGATCGDSQCYLSCDSDLDCTPMGQLCAGSCVDCVADGDCASDEFCLDGECAPRVCEPDSQECDGSAVVTCNDRGSGFASRIDCGSRDCLVDGDEATCEVDANCQSGSVDLCSSIPRFTGTQVLDGSADDFCVPAMTFALTEAGWVNPSYDGDLPTVVTARVGWSNDAMHVHVHVEDPAIYISSSTTTNKWNGDSVQVFLAGTDALTGTYTGTQDGGATHIIATPDGTAIEIFESSSVLTSTFTGVAARSVDDGYEIELQIPWDSSADPRSAGAAFGFNLGVTADDTGTGSQLEGMLANHSVTTPASYCASSAFPGCDDRTWCLPVLE